MFWLLMISGGFGALVCVIAAVNFFKGGTCGGNKARNRLIFGSIAAFACAIFIGIFAMSFYTAQGQMMVAKLSAGTTTGNWLVIDNSGGETMRHWIIEDGYVESSDQSDGWQFYDNKKNLCYVSGDAYVMKISMPLDEFRSTYKAKYKIPVEQVALD